MFYKMIEKKRGLWLTSDDCTVKDLFGYIQNKAQLRDAQIDAIKTYLYLKIACASKPLAELFIQGEFNTLPLEDVELSSKVRSYLMLHPEAAALFEYACLKNEAGIRKSILVGCMRISWLSRAL